MRGVGKDATKLFNEVHAWVNYQQLLNKCIIGPLKASTKLEKALEESTKIIATTKKSVKFSKPPLPPQDVTPRLDWIQNRNSITLYFYTKQFCNPGSLIRNLNQEKEISHIEIWILIDINLHKYKFEFHGQVKWPPKDVKISTESGKIEIVFEKPEENKNLWQELGKYEVKKILRNSVEDELLIEFIINRKTQYNHDSFTMEMKNEHVIYNMPLGYHVSIEGLINSAKLSKCYTPIPIKYLRDCEDNECKEQNLYFIIKKYNHPNSFSSYLNSVANKSVLNISIPKGNFKLSSLAGHRALCFLAAGSGLTPFLSLIEHLLKRNTNRM